MFQRKGSGSVSIIATIAGLAVMGVAGYNLMTGDCSSCIFTGSAAPTTTATTVATSSSDKDGACALGSCSGESAPATELVATSAEGTCGADKLAEGTCGLSQACGDTTADTTDAQLVSSKAEVSEKACGSVCDEASKAACDADKAPQQAEAGADPVGTPVAAAPGN